MAYKSVFLEKMGIFGWDSREPIIMAALIAGKAVCWEGLHGTAKTQISEAISYSFLGGQKSRKFRYFNCPIASQDELLGYPDLAAMKKGEIKYISTPTSVWGGNSVLMDEINRCSPGMQGKFMELALTGRVMGQETGIDFRFAAVNPPSIYLTTPMDMAALSRFAVVNAPSFKEIFQSDHSAARKIASAVVKETNLVQEYKEIVDTKLPSDVMELIDNIVDQYVGEIFTQFVDKINYSGRQANDLRKMLCGFYKFYKASGVNIEDSELHDIHAELALAVIPEATKLINPRLCIDRIQVFTSFVSKSFDAIRITESDKVSIKALKVLKSDKPKPSEVQEILESISPEKWKEVRDKLPKNKVFDKINTQMSYMNIPDTLVLDNMLEIKQAISLY